MGERGDTWFLAWLGIGIEETYAGIHCLRPLPDQNISVPRRLVPVPARFWHYYYFFI
jgi:hypothetical protein